MPSSTYTVSGKVLQWKEVNSHWCTGTHTGTVLCDGITTEGECLSTIIILSIVVSTNILYVHSMFANR